MTFSGDRRKTSLLGVRRVDQGPQAAPYLLLDEIDDRYLLIIPTGKVGEHPQREFTEIEELPISAYTPEQVSEWHNRQKQMVDRIEKQAEDGALAKDDQKLIIEHLQSAYSASSDGQLWYRLGGPLSNWAKQHSAFDGEERKDLYAVYRAAKLGKFTLSPDRELWYISKVLEATILGFPLRRHLRELSRR